MKRLSALAPVACCLLVLGCGVRSYELRMNKTLENLRYRQQLDKYLTGEAGDPFKALSIFVRPPKPLKPAEAFQLSDYPGFFDAQATFLGTPELPSAGGQGDQSKSGGPGGPEAAPPAFPMRLHVLARVKQTAAATKKEEAPAEAQTQRGPFQQDVLSLVANDFGAAEVVQSETLKPDKKGPNDFKRLIFPTQYGTVQVYLFSQKTPMGDYDVALIWDIPGEFKSTLAVVKGIPYTLETLAVGPRAQAAFGGAVGEDDFPPPGVPGLPGGPGGGAPGTAF